MTDFRVYLCIWSPRQWDCHFHSQGIFSLQKMCDISTAFSVVKTSLTFPAAFESEADIFGNRVKFRPLTHGNVFSRRYSATIISRGFPLTCSNLALFLTSCLSSFTRKNSDTKFQFPPTTKQNGFFSLLFFFFLKAWKFLMPYLGLHVFSPTSRTGARFGSKGSYLCGNAWQQVLVCKYFPSQTSRTGTSVSVSRIRAFHGWSSQTTDKQTSEVWHTDNPDDRERRTVENRVNEQTTGQAPLWRSVSQGAPTREVWG